MLAMKKEELAVLGMFAEFDGPIAERDALALADVHLSQNKDAARVVVYCLIARKFLRSSDAFWPKWEITQAGRDYLATLATTTN